MTSKILILKLYKTEKYASIVCPKRIEWVVVQIIIYYAASYVPSNKQ